jgi:hypothetical protein
LQGAFVLGPSTPPLPATQGGSHRHVGIGVVRIDRKGALRVLQLITSRPRACSTTARLLELRGGAPGIHGATSGARRQPTGVQ